jgi:hypothetical protein
MRLVDTGTTAVVVDPVVVVAVEVELLLAEEFESLPFESICSSLMLVVSILISVSANDPFVEVNFVAEPFWLFAAFTILISSIDFESISILILEGSGWFGC